MTADIHAERAKVLRRLELQRQSIDNLFRKLEISDGAMTGAASSGFPKSQTMRLLLSEPVFAAGLGALVTRVLGPRAMHLLRAMVSAFRAARNVSHGHGSPPL